MGIATRELLGRGSVYTLSTVLSMGSALIMLPFLTRVLSVDQFGTVALALVVGQLIALVANLSLPAAITRAHFFDEGTGAAAERLVVDGALIASVTTASLATTSIWWWQPVLGADWSEAAPLAVLYGGLLSVVQMLLALLRALERPWTFVLSSSTSSVGGIALGLGLCYAERPSPVLYLVGLAAAQVVALLVATRGAYAGRHFETPLSGYRRRALAIALPVVPHLLALQGLMVGLRAVLQTDLGAEAVARFHVTFTVGSLSIVLLSALNNAWAPLVFKASSQDRPEVLRETTRAALLVSGTVAAVTVLLSPFVLAIMAPGAYDTRSLVPATIIVALAGPVYALYLAEMHLITASGKTRGLALTTPASAVGTLIVVALAVNGGLGVPAAAAGVPVFYFVLVLAGRYLARGQSSLALPYGLACAAVVGVAVFGLGVVLLQGTPNGGLLLIGLAAVAGGLGSWQVMKAVRQTVSRTP